MTKPIKGIMTFVASIVGFVIVALIALSIMSRYTGDPGLRGGHLQECPVTPNCVVSEDVDGKNIDPIDISGMEASVAWQRLNEAVVATGGEVKEDDGHYLRATYSSAVFRFIDDFEARLDEENNVIHLRSASRVGHGDMGANQKRVVRIVAQFQNTTD
jgi:uncharacterized protein (DUF1499 family)